MREFMMLATAAATIAVCALAAEAQTFAISIGIRETGTTAPIGQNGGTSGGLEWVNVDGQMLTLDGSWQTFRFNFRDDPLTPFAAVGANGMYDVDRGTFDHIRIRNSSGITAPVTLWIDHIVHTTADGVFTISDFEGFGNGVEVTFQEPGFSGSTSNFLAPPPAPNSALTSDAMAIQGTHSNEVKFQFASDSTAAWVRLITFNTPNLPNPTIDFTDGNTLTFQVKGLVVPEPTAAALAGLAGLGILLRRGRR